LNRLAEEAEKMAREAEDTFFKAKEAADRARKEAQDANLETETWKLHCLKTLRAKQGGIQTEIQGCCDRMRELNLKLAQEKETFNRLVKEEDETVDLISQISGIISVNEKKVLQSLIRVYRFNQGH